MITLNIVNNAVISNNDFNLYFDIIGCERRFGLKRYIFKVKRDTKLIFFAKGIRTVIIPAGFIFDGFSFRANDIRLQLKYFFPALIHDFFYSTKLVERKVADQILFEMLRNEENIITSFIIYAGVRLFGGRFYGSDKLNIK